MKLALITGASSGIGAATAREMARLGYRVILVARSREKLEEVAASIGDAAAVEACDASDGDAVLALANRVRSMHGVPDVIVNSAGAGAWKRIEETTPAEAREMMAAPYFSAFNVTHAFMRDMLARKSGTIVHVGSPASYVAWPSSVGYAAGRGALRGLHEALSADLAGTGVKSCHVVFGRVDSPYFATNVNVEDRMPGLARIVPRVKPDDCARVIARVVRRPRDTTMYPAPLRITYGLFKLFPGVTRRLLRRTGYTPPGASPGDRRPEDGLL
jgi:short-subunit dehydrogenase